MVGTSSTPRNFARSFLRHLTSSWGGSQEVCGPTRRCPTCPGAPLKPPPSSPSLRVSLSRCSSPTPSPSRPRWRKRFFRRRSIRGLRGLEISNNNLCGIIAKYVTRLRRGYAGYVGMMNKVGWVASLVVWFVFGRTLFAWRALHFGIAHWGEVGDFTNAQIGPQKSAPGCPVECGGGRHAKGSSLCWVTYFGLWQIFSNLSCWAQCGKSKKWCWPVVSDWF